MDTKYYYFYDLNEVLIDRYPSKIAHHIQQIDPSAKFVFIYSEIYSSKSPKTIPDGSFCFYLKDLSKRKLNEIIQKFPPISLTTIAQRIPDMWMLSYFNHLHVPTYIVQHGLWSDRLVRIPLIPLIFGKLNKFIGYIKNTLAICKLNQIPFFPTLIDLYKFLLAENITIPETKFLDNNNIRASKAFIFDESWDDYYIKKYGYNKSKLIYIGNPDLLLLKGRDLSKKEDAVCYLCQSLVEDGRFNRERYLEFLQILKSEIPSKKKLYIKLHPRTRIEIYECLRNIENIEFINDLPLCEYYIGHYTGLLATVKQISDNILIWLLPNHHIPEYFQGFGSNVTNTTDDLKEFILGNKKINSANQLFYKLSSKELQEFNPIQTIAKNLLNN